LTPTIFVEIGNFVIICIIPVNKNYFNILW